jgi:hypothetical protein
VDGELVIKASVADVPGSDIGIRHATSADGGALSAFAERILRETFGRDNTAANLDLYRLQASFCLGGDVQTDRVMSRSLDLS